MPDSSASAMRANRDAFERWCTLSECRSVSEIEPALITAGAPARDASASGAPSRQRP